MGHFNALTSEDKTKKRIEKINSFLKKNNGRIISGEYLNKFSFLTFQCEKGHIWDSQVQTLFQGYWCKICRKIKNKNPFFEKLQLLVDKQNGKILYGEYLNKFSKFKIQCSRKHIWETTAESILRGIWCKECKKSNKISSLLNDVKENIKQKKGKYISGNCINKKSIIEVQCEKGHTWQTQAGGILNGSWCRQCWESKDLMINRINSVIKEKNGTLLLGEYNNKRSVFKIMCEVGHIWETQAQGILKGSWCRKCWNIKGAGKHLINQNGLQEASEIAKSRDGLCLSKEYISNKYLMKWECSNGHRWDAALNDIKKGTWCPECGSGLRERLCRYIFEELTALKFKKYRPKWLINSRGNRMELDGYNSDLSIAFEYNGAQHYVNVSHFQRREETLNQRILDDEIKLKLCKQNNVNLLVIPYTLGLKQMPKYIYDYLIELIPSDKIKSYKELNYSGYVSSNQLKELQKIAERQGGKCLSKIYKGSQYKHKFSCKKGHKWLARATNIIHNQTWCPICKPEKIGNAIRKYSVEDMHKFANKNRGNFLSKVFKSVNDVYRWECSNNHVWDSLASEVIRGKWCVICKKNNKLIKRLEEMKKIAAQRGGICLSNEYINSISKLHWQCKNGHNWYARPDNVKNSKSWCPLCNAPKS